MFIRTIGKIIVISSIIYIKIVLDPTTTFFGKKRSSTL